MKYLYLLLILSMTACYKNTNKVFVPANMDECVSLYNHILELEVDQTLFGKVELNSVARREAIKLLNEELSQQGTTGRFYQYCISKMTSDQVQCGLRASNIDNINACKLEN